MGAGFKVFGLSVRDVGLGFLKLGGPFLGLPIMRTKYLGVSVVKLSKLLSPKASSATNQGSFHAARPHAFRNP